MKMFQDFLSLIFIIIYFSAASIQGADQHEKKAYIVYMGHLPEAAISIEEDHHDLLVKAIGDERLARESRIHSYKKSFNGFVARLLPDEANKLSNEERVISVFVNTKRKLHTTRSWDFLGVPFPEKHQSEIQNGIVVGVLDTGIWVDAPSFSDKGYGPSPAKWKGKCLKGGNFTGCNKKVIGAKFFNLDNMDTDMDPSPVDYDGHGTHTSSTIAGVPVKGASLYGIAKGTARGGVPAARVAMYKVCWDTGCTDMDLLAAFDEAIADGVDVISVSIGGPSRDFFDDPIAIGAFHAMDKGILTSCSAGNDGPYLGTVQNVAPWVITVAASSTDRQLNTAVQLGDGKKASGINAINTFSPKKKMYPLTSGVLASNVTKGSYGNASACDYGTLAEKKVKGKIVYCIGNAAQDYTIKKLGGAGAVLTTAEDLDYATATFIAATFLGVKDGMEIDKYINSTKNPQAVIHKTIDSKVSAPFLASFSSRGPEQISRNILKPDIAAPGLNILAGYSKLTSVTGVPSDHRHPAFNIISGTSMSCPHGAAAAAYVKSFHPDWSPAAVKSALMTTATPLKLKDTDDRFGTGSGQINPSKAVHPGLIYDIDMISYIRFLCKSGYERRTIGQLNGGKELFNCSKLTPAQGTDGLNYPTMYTEFEKGKSTVSAVFHRTVTNVGYGNSVYKANINSPKNLLVRVVPNTLKFERLHQTLSFNVVVKSGPISNRTEIISASLEWNDSEHNVKSNILIYKPNLG